VRDVLVIGAGVSGLTTGVCLAEAGLSVLVRAERPPGETTSAVAGALWGLHMVESSDRALDWSVRALAEFERLAGDAASSTGVRLVTGVQAARTQTPQPSWANALGDCQPCAAAELPAGYRLGWRSTAPLADMPTYLGYLQGRFTAADGKIEAGVVGSLPAAAREARAVVNCTGAGARGLVPDPDVTPVRGQVVMVRNPGITEYFVDVGASGPELRYFFAHPAVVVLGGTAEHGGHELRPDPQTARRILDGCAAVEPRLRGAEVIAHRVGLRPVRPEVRVEAQHLPGGGLLCHNYGHGGAGVTLSWGCARDVADLIIGELL
jgi:D-amino-acid oxidase